MSVLRILVLAAAATGLFAAAPASAQFFFKAPDLSGEPVTGSEPGVTGPDMPGATPAEFRAAMIWNLRAALNVAALQCYFEPTLLTDENYNAMLRDHGAELRAAHDVIQKYFTRTIKDKKAAQTEFDRFLTRVYSSFSTIQAQYTFCSTAAALGHDVLFVKPGRLGDLAQDRMRELRNSLVPHGEQQFPRTYVSLSRFPFAYLPPFANEQCWKKGAYVERKCGPLPGSTVVAG